MANLELENTGKNIGIRAWDAGVGRTRIFKGKCITHFAANKSSECGLQDCLVDIHTFVSISVVKCDVHIWWQTNRLPHNYGKLS